MKVLWLVEADFGHYPLFTVDTNSDRKRVTGLQRLKHVV